MHINFIKIKNYILFFVEENVAENLLKCADFVDCIKSEFYWDLRNMEDPCGKFCEKFNLRNF